MLKGVNVPFGPTVSIVYAMHIMHPPCAIIFWSCQIICFCLDKGVNGLVVQGVSPGSG